MCLCVRAHSCVGATRMLLSRSSESGWLDASTQRSREANSPASQLHSSSRLHDFSVESQDSASFWQMNLGQASVAVPSRQITPLCPDGRRTAIPRLNLVNAIPACIFRALPEKQMELPMGCREKSAKSVGDAGAKPRNTRHVGTPRRKTTNTCVKVLKRHKD